MNSNDSSWLALVLQYPFCVTPCMQLANKNTRCGISDIECHCVAGLHDWVKDLSDCFNQTAACNQQDYDYFSKLSYETCKQYRTEPYPSFNANRTNITTLVTALNTTGQDRSPLNSTQLQRHSSLSTAAYAGIGLGTGAFILGLAALATFFYRRKNTWKSGQSGIHEMSASNLQELAAVNDRKEPQELHATEGNVSNHPVELDANFIYELEVSKR